MTSCYFFTRATRPSGQSAGRVHLRDIETLDPASPCPQPLPMPYQRFVRQLDRGLIGVLSMSAVVNSLRIDTVYWYQAELGEQVKLVEVDVRGEEFAVTDGVNLRDR